MIINNTLQGVAGVYGQSNTMRKNRQDFYTGAADSADAIEISSQGQKFNEILQKLKAGSEVRQDKVSFYKSLVSSGNYNVDSTKIAEGILHSRF